MTQRTPLLSSSSVGAPVRGRYAPTPSGFLHLGNARTALLAWLQVRAAQGTFVLRIEDLDRDRSRPEFESALLRDLEWLGLHWDEGPGADASHEPYRQSERSEYYRAALAGLDTYVCRCTRSELRRASLAPHGHEPVYPGTCREAGWAGAGALRWRVPSEVSEVDDALMGQLRQDLANDVGDFVLCRSDGAFAYQLAVVVDDALMQITDVVRGADLLESTPRQLALQRALGYPHPRYAHVPLLLGADGQKLSKRHRAPSLTALRERAVDPRRVIGWLVGSLGWARESHVSPGELVHEFALASVPQAATPVTASEDSSFDS